MVHVRLCRAATKSGDKDWYKKIDEKVIEDCMQLGACCPVNWLACLCSERIQRETYLSSIDMYNNDVGTRFMK